MPHLGLCIVCARTGAPHQEGPHKTIKKIYIYIYIVQGSYRRFRNMKFKTFKNPFDPYLRPYKHVHERYAVIKTKDQTLCEQFLK